MTIQYDAEADAAYIRITDSPVGHTQEESDVCILDLDTAGNLVGIELLSVFGFAGASLSDLASKGLVTCETADRLLHDLRDEMVTA